jgi:hypothetical protein
MTALPIDLTDDDFMTALRTFILSVLPTGVEVFQSQANRVAEPIGPDFIMMTPAGRVRLATNVDLWDKTDPDPDTLTIAAATQLTVQLDCHGPNGSDFAQTISTLWRDDYGCQNLDPTGAIAPLYATDPNQMPFINGENQYENRWVLSVVMQGTPTISTPQEFAAIVTATIVPIIGG